MKFRQEIMPVLSLCRVFNIENESETCLKYVKVTCQFIKYYEMLMTWLYMYLPNLHYSKYCFWN